MSVDMAQPICLLQRSDFVMAEGSSSRVEKSGRGQEAAGCSVLLAAGASCNFVDLISANRTSAGTPLDLQFPVHAVNLDRRVISFCSFTLAHLPQPPSSPAANHCCSAPAFMSALCSLVLSARSSVGLLVDTQGRQRGPKRRPSAQT
jgi:hypothetical protein